MYPVLVNNINRVKFQPLYSEFKLEINENLYSVNVNESTEQIMLLSNGVNSVEEICSELAAKTQEELHIVENLVSEFLIQANQYGHILFLENCLDTPKTIQSYGSKDYWTPDLVAIELTDLCPLNCRHCYVSKNTDLIMNDSLFTSIVNQVKDLKIEQVQLTGGEPLLHKSFFNILSELVSAGVFVHIFTSGFINDPNTIAQFDRFSRNKIAIQVSIDGLRDYHDDFRRKAGSFDRAIDFLKSMNEKGFKTIVGITVVDQKFEELSELCEICKGVGVDSIRIGVVSSRGEAKASNLIRTKEETEYTLNTQKRLAEKYSSDKINIVINEADQINNSSEYTKNCGVGQAILKISPSGKVYPCILSDLFIGDLNKTTLKKILKEKSRFFEKLEIPDRYICSKCVNEILCSKCIIEALMYSEEYKLCYWRERNGHLIKQIMESGE